MSTEIPLPIETKTSATQTIRNISQNKLQHTTEKDLMQVENRTSPITLKLPVLKYQSGVCTPPCQRDCHNQMHPNAIYPSQVKNECLYPLAVNVPRLPTYYHTPLPKLAEPAIFVRPVTRAQPNQIQLVDSYCWSFQFGLIKLKKINLNNRYI